VRRLVCASACVFHINNIALPFSVFRVSPTHFSSFLTRKFARNLFMPPVKLKFSLWKPWRCMGSGNIAPLIPKFGTIVGLMFSFTPEESYPLLTLRIEQKVGWAPQSVWSFWRREKSVPLPGMEPWFLDCPAVPSSLQLRTLYRPIYITCMS
jgi:hypothetical protein